MTALTYTVAQGAAKIPCSPRWLVDGLRSGRFPGRKIAGHWALTEDDLNTIVSLCKVAPAEPETQSWAQALAPRSRARQ